ncbi:MAG: class I SAM-dependent methyltransferase [Deltaproteobacteria bacterium]|nr:class I SAM-dependent methyltransferase [Deltaproteobacteria bacterium]MBI3296421.1 class I SAM-dependent methyltransferase [Deltaproteobacteria bacterium]
MKETVHETITVSEERSPRNYLVRQERISLPQNRCYLTIRNSQLEVINYTPFGLLARTALRLEIGEEFPEIALTYDGMDIGTYHLRVTRSQTLSPPADKVTHMTPNSVALEVIGEPLDTLLISAIDKAATILDSHKEERQRHSAIPALFKQKVLEVKDWLETLQENCESLENDLDWERPDVMALRDNIAQVIGGWIGNEIPAIYEAIQREFQTLDEEQIRDCVDYLRDKLRHLVYRSPLADRAFKKPLGYAGDHQMMSIVYDNQHAGDSLFAKCVHQYFMQESATKAVQNRAHYLKNKIKDLLLVTQGDRPLKIISVACGPAKEIELLMEEEPDLRRYNLEVVLLDQDLGALQEAQRRMMKLTRKYPSNFKFKYLNLAIKNIIVRGLPESDFDMVYSAGLFDYFSDPVVLMAADRLFRGVRENGTMIIGNFDVKNPSQRMMELVMDWELIYRSEDDLRRLFGHLPGTVSVEEEEEKVNLFCNVTKLGAKQNNGSQS